MNDVRDYVSAAVARALHRAGVLAHNEQAAAIEPRHVVTALLGGEPDGLAAISAIRHGYCSHEPLMQLHESTADTPSVETLSAAVLSALRAARHLASEVTGELLLCVLMDRHEELQNSLKSSGLDAASFRESVLHTHAEPIAIVEPLEITASPDTLGPARAIDANVNRAREAARVLEDYARFCLDDPGLTRSFKELRHQLRDLPVQLGLPPVAGRDTSHDVGTTITTTAEYHRADVQQVVAANAKRLQEALRSLEEFSKLIRPEIARQIEQARYEAYTLEVALCTLRFSQDRLADVRLYWLFTGSACRVTPERAVAEAIEGGVQMIQLREKNLADDALLARAKQLRAWTRKAKIPLIINDRPDIARLVDADGVHLGQNDLPVTAARAILGSQAIVGVSTHDIDQVRQAVRDGANYIGVGPTFPSTTKDFADLAGLDFVKAATAETNLPAFILGGITSSNLSDVITAGGQRIAVSAAISNSEHPRHAAQTLVSKF